MDTRRLRKKKNCVLKRNNERCKVNAKMYNVEYNSSGPYANGEWRGVNSYLSEQNACMAGDW